jgi:hypothetical protein
MRPIEEILERVKKVRERGCPKGVNHFLRCELEPDESFCHVWCEDCGWECMVKADGVGSVVPPGAPLPEMTSPEMSGYVICDGTGRIRMAIGEHLPVDASGHQVRCALLFFNKDEAQHNACGDAQVHEVNIQRVA